MGLWNKAAPNAAVGLVTNNESESQKTTTNLEDQMAQWTCNTVEAKRMFALDWRSMPQTRRTHETIDRHEKTEDPCFVVSKKLDSLVLGFGVGVGCGFLYEMGRYLTTKLYPNEFYGKKSERLLLRHVLAVWHS